MPIRRHTSFLLAWLVIGCCLAGPLPARAAGTVTFKAVLIYASDEPAPLDRRLEAIEYKLRRMLKFAHYRHSGEGSITLNLPGAGAIPLAGGHQVRISATDAGGQNVRAQVQWLRGGQALVSTTVKLGRRSPAVLGGISERNGQLIVCLTAY